MTRLKDKETANTKMDGQRIYYNFISPHMSLDGKTPAQQSNLGLRLGRNKWLSLTY